MEKLRALALAGSAYAARPHLAFGKSMAVEDGVAPAAALAGATRSIDESSVTHVERCRYVSKSRVGIGLLQTQRAPQEVMRHKFESAARSSRSCSNV